MSEGQVQCVSEQEIEAHNAAAALRTVWHRALALCVAIEGGDHGVLIAARCQQLLLEMDDAAALVEQLLVGDL